MPEQMVDVTVSVPADKVDTVRRCADLLASGSPECGAIEQIVAQARVWGKMSDAGDPA